MYCSGLNRYLYTYQAYVDTFFLLEIIKIDNKLVNMINGIDFNKK